ncbi:hypothetical protein UPYG_G00130650 [Umbra pygmaea]|uniref:Uncharacterized protein n=1 Tax=Umbra pygmaea TaxID=75934 RepID=A0ABD0X0H0_UMBPY
MTNTGVISMNSHCHHLSCLLACCSSLLILAIMLDRKLSPHRLQGVPDVFSLISSFVLWVHVECWRPRR